SQFRSKDLIKLARKLRSGVPSTTIPTTTQTDSSRYNKNDVRWCNIAAVIPRPANLFFER
ncbi:MAG: hypothetical protein KA368_12585, partial [Acidobacteria bacterium]|nr:hypothetical protein [Acidobacteriota bacterium]